MNLNNERVVHLKDKTYKCLPSKHFFSACFHKLNSSNSERLYWQKGLFFHLEKPFGIKLDYWGKTFLFTCFELINTGKKAIEICLMQTNCNITVVLINVQYLYFIHL